MDAKSAMAYLPYLIKPSSLIKFAQIFFVGRNASRSKDFRQAINLGLFADILIYVFGHITHVSRGINVT